MLDWLNDIAEWIGNLIPDWDLLEPTHGGVKFSYGGRVTELRPGYIYWYWPAISKVVTMPIKRQTLSFTQRLTSKDGVTLSATAVIVYDIDDVIKALVETNDFEDTIEEVSQKLTIKPLMSRQFDDTCADMAESNDMRNELTRAARTLLGSYGVRVLDSYVSDFTETKVLYHEGEGLSISTEEEEDE